LGFDAFFVDGELDKGSDVGEDFEAVFQADGDLVFGCCFGEELNVVYAILVLEAEAVSACARYCGFFSAVGVCGSMFS